MPRSPAKPKPRKYDHVLHKLPRISAVDPERADIVAAVEEEILAPPSDDDPKEDAGALLTVMTTALHRLYDVRLRAAAGKNGLPGVYANLYRELRDDLDAIDLEVGNLGILLEAYTDLVVKSYDENNIERINLYDGKPVSVHYEPYPEYEDKEKFRQWCIKEGLEREMHYHFNSMAALTKLRLAEGKSEPPGIKTSSRPKVSFK